MTTAAALPESMTDNTILLVDEAPAELLDWCSLEGESLLVEAYCAPFETDTQTQWDALEPLLRDKLCELLAHLQALLPNQAPALAGRVADVDISFVSNPWIQRLNESARGKEQPTDVLSFPVFEAEQLRDMTAELPPQCSIGSIVISVDWALQALQQAYPSPTIEDHCAYLLERVIHGCLHLLGQHHDTQTDFERVLGYQHRLLNRLNLPILKTEGS